MAGPAPPAPLLRLLLAAIVLCSAVRGSAGGDSQPFTGVGSAAASFSKLEHVLIEGNLRPSGFLKPLLQHGHSVPESSLRSGAAFIGSNHRLRCAGVVKG
jgi:hypothetical protein